jgi:hypothetical protein
MAEKSVTGESNIRSPKISAIFRELSIGRPRSCSELLADLQPPAEIDAHSLHFAGVVGRDVYNITAPFRFDGDLLIIGRVEPRETEFSEIVVFKSAGGDEWTPRYTRDDFNGLQDPCVTWAGENLVVGGVRYPVEMPSGGIGCQMEFYRGTSLENLRKFLTGPLGMKDIRFKQLPDGRVAVFSRPQGAIGGRGQIGFMIASSWDAITPEMIATAPLFSEQILKEEWGGVNEVHLLSKGRLGILGHIACFDDQHNRHYYPMAFSVDLATREPSEIRIIAQRTFFPPAEAKRPDLTDVVFSGGIVRNGDGTVYFYAGTGDTAAAFVKLPDPFIQYEI